MKQDVEILHSPAHIDFDQRILKRFKEPNPKMYKDKKTKQPNVAHTSFQ